MTGVLGRTVLTRRPDRRLPRPREKSRAENAENCWVPPGGSARVHDYEIPGGMVYVGKKLAPAHGWGIEPALIDPSLAVEGKSLATVGIWLSYDKIAPHHRAAYLKWLAGGRVDPDCEIRNVFLFFYGLERRVLADAENNGRARAEIPAIREEVLRLLSIYGEDRSFRSFASRFLGFISKEQFLTDEIGSPPKVGRYEPVSLRISIGRMAKDGIGVPGDWALAWLKSGELSLRTPGRRCPGEFDELFQIEFSRRYPDGMRVKECKRKVLIRYYPASLGFACDGLKHTFDVPDVTALVGPKRQLSKIADWCQDELQAYSRWLCRNPKHTLASVAPLPQDLLNIHNERGDVTVCPAEGAKEIPKRVVLDHGKIAVMQEESIKVSRMIFEIFEEEPETDDGFTPDEAEGTGELDKEHSTLLVGLGKKESWERSDYEKLVEEIGLLPDGALETLNEAAYDLCDEPLTDGTDPILIDPDVYREVTG